MSSTDACSLVTVPVVPEATCKAGPKTSLCGPRSPSHTDSWCEQGATSVWGAWEIPGLASYPAESAYRGGLTGFRKSPVVWGGRVVCGQTRGARGELIFTEARAGYEGAPGGHQGRAAAEEQSPRGRRPLPLASKLKDPHSENSSGVSPVPTMCF